MFSLNADSETSIRGSSPTFGFLQIRQRQDNMRSCRLNKYLPSLTLLCLFALLVFVTARSWLVYSPVFKGENEEWLPAALAKNERASTVAQNYLKSLIVPETLAFYQKRLQQPSDILVIVITCLRASKENTEKTLYLTQVMSALDQEMKTTSLSNISLLICNTETGGIHTEVANLSMYFPVVSIFPHSPPIVNNARKKEKADYVACLEKIKLLDAKNVLVLQDDAVPLPNLFNNVQFLLRYKIERFIRQGELIVPNTQPWGQIKLYYPERWQGFAWEFDRVIELLALILLVPGTVALLRYCLKPSLNWSNLMISSIKVTAFTAVFVILVGRQYFIRWRLWSPYFFNVLDAPGCCIPAVIYPKAILGRLIAFLDSAECSSQYPLDVAIDDFLREIHLASYLVEPNLFQHIGMYSTLTTPKDSYYFV